MFFLINYPKAYRMGNCASYSYSIVPDDIIDMAKEEFKIYLKTYLDRNFSCVPSVKHEVEWIKLEKIEAIEGLEFLNVHSFVVKLVYIDTINKFIYSDFDDNLHDHIHIKPNNCYTKMYGQNEHNIIIAEYLITGLWDDIIKMCKQKGNYEPYIKCSDSEKILMIRSLEDVPVLMDIQSTFLNQENSSL